MKIYVCVKHVPDSAVNIRILGRTGIDETVNFFINPYDEHAITEAVRIKEILPGSELVAVCLGKEDAEKTLRSAMAMGADRAILIVSHNRHDSIETAQALKAAIDQDGTPGLIFTGKEAIDTQGAQTLFRLAALFDYPVATNVVKLDVATDNVTVDSELAGGIINTYKMSLPCVIGAGRGLNTPIYPTFPSVMKSRKKPVKKMAVTSLGLEPSLTNMEIVELELLVQKRVPQEISGDAEAVAQKIINILEQEAKVM